MSQFCTMTARERQIQAAAICREIQGPEGVEMDLGKKLSVPQDIMLEELSLTTNRGSVLFKKRQQRSEKYTFESIQNQTNAAVTMRNVELLQTENGNAENNQQGVVDDQHPKPPPNTPMTPDTRACESNPDCIAPGYGGPLKDVPPERFNSTSFPKAYRSPWEQAIFSDPALAETLLVGPMMPEPCVQPELPGYKCFNRVAIPFRGFGHSSSSTPPPVSVKSLDLPAPPPELHEDPGANKRPTFNRAPQGWVSSGVPSVRLPAAVSLDPSAFIPESDDL